MSDGSQKSQSKISQKSSEGGGSPREMKFELKSDSDLSSYLQEKDQSMLSL